MPEELKVKYEVARKSGKATGDARPARNKNVATEGAIHVLQNAPPPDAAVGMKRKWGYDPLFFVQSLVKSPRARKRLSSYVASRDKEDPTANRAQAKKRILESMAEEGETKDAKDLQEKEDARKETVCLTEGAKPRAEGETKKAKLTDQKEKERAKEYAKKCREKKKAERLGAQ